MHRFMYLLLLSALPGFAQPDSVIVMGQIGHLSARLYRLSPNVVVTRTNIVRGGSEQAFLAPLQPDGQFRVAVPLIYPLEEMTIQLGGGDRSAVVSFLAAAGQVRVIAENDSLFRAKQPFRFEGVNAQVNQQHAQYEANVASQQQAAGKSDRERAVRRALNAPSPSQAYPLLTAAFTAPFEQFAATRNVFPLVRSWVRSVAQFEAAAVLLERATASGQPLAPDLLKTMLTTDAKLLTPTRASALDRLGAYMTTLLAQTASSQNSVRIPLLVALLTQYGSGLTNAERERLAAMREKGRARTADLRFLSGLVERNADTLNRLLIFEQTLQRARTQLDSSSADYLKAYLLTSAIPQARQRIIRFIGDYIRPQIGDPLLRQSFSEAVGQALRDTAQVEQARTQYRALEKLAGVTYGPVAEGIYVSTGTFRRGDELLQAAIDRNRGKVIYLILWSPEQETGRQLARDAQRLRDVFDGRELALLYVSLGNTDDELWLESLVRNQLRGDHIRISDQQTYDVTAQLALSDQTPVFLVTPQGKVYKRRALPPSPEEFSKLIAQIRALLN